MKATNANAVARFNSDPPQVGPQSGTVCYGLQAEGGSGSNAILIHTVADRGVAITIDPTPRFGPPCGSSALGEPVRNGVRALDSRDPRLARPHQSPDYCCDRRCEVLSSPVSPRSARHVVTHASAPLDSKSPLRTPP